MSDEHVTHRDLEELRRGTLAPAHLLRIARHLGTCPQCAATARGGVPVGDVAEAFIVGGHPRVDAELTRYVDGKLSRERRAEIAGHLASCARCRDDVGDLQTERARLQWPGRRNRIMAIAATVAIVTAAIAFVRLPRPIAQPVPRVAVAHRAPPHATYGRADWDAAVGGAVGSHRIAPPAILAGLRPPAEVLRGGGSAEPMALEPSGVVIDDVRPRFTWTPSAGARYIVSVAADGVKVSGSAEIGTPEWTPAKPLRRGVTYTWQVEVRSGGSTQLIPAPPQPEARFHILDETSSADLRDAERRYPNDHLLLGVLAARAGLRQRAEGELRLAAVPVAGDLLRNLETW